MFCEVVSQLRLLRSNPSYAFGIDLQHDVNKGLYSLISTPFEKGFEVALDIIQNGKLWTLGRYITLVAYGQYFVFHVRRVETIDVFCLLYWMLRGTS